MPLSLSPGYDHYKRNGRPSRRPLRGTHSIVLITGDCDALRSSRVPRPSRGMCDPRDRRRRSAPARLRLHAVTTLTSRRHRTLLARVDLSVAAGRVHSTEKRLPGRGRSANDATSHVQIRSRRRPCGLGPGSTRISTRGVYSLQEGGMSEGQGDGATETSRPPRSAGGVPRSQAAAAGARIGR